MSLRVVFMGMLGVFSALPLERMLSAGTNVCAVLVPSTTSVPIRLVSSPPLRADLLLQPHGARNVVQLARDHALAAHEVSDLRHPQTLAALAALQPDVIVVACFPFILPKRVWQLPKHGCFNLHPSLLPKMRGPDPLFWVFHEGDGAGVTLHRVSARVDVGDIAAQQPLHFADGIRYADAERLCAEAGAALIVETLARIERGTLATQTQDEHAASYFPQPSPADFIITPDWTVQRAFNFIRALAPNASPTIQVGERALRVVDAFDYTRDERMSEPFCVQGAELRVQFADGVLRAVLAP